MALGNSRKIIVWKQQQILTLLHALLYYENTEKAVKIGTWGINISHVSLCCQVILDAFSHYISVAQLLPMTLSNGRKIIVWKKQQVRIDPATCSFVL